MNNKNNRKLNYIPEEEKEKILSLNKQHKSIRNISQLTNIRRDILSIFLKSSNVDLGYYHDKANIIVDSESVVCSECNIEKSLNQFQFGRRNEDSQYRYSFCNTCRNRKTRRRIYSRPENYFKTRVGVIRRRYEGNFNLTVEYLVDLYTKQQGKCFYTDVELIFGKANGLSERALSIDKINRELGYIQGNIVLCTSRANSIKYTQSLDELKEWMPTWYQKLKGAEFVTVI